MRVHVRVDAEVPGGHSLLRLAHRRLVERALSGEQLRVEVPRMLDRAHLATSRDQLIIMEVRVPVQ